MKNLKKFSVLYFIAILFLACENSEKKAIAKINSKSGSNVSGTVTFTEKNDKIMMLAEINGLTPGTHAIHIHEKGDCSSDDGKSAGGHWNPTGDNHGKWKHGAFHSGDIGNLEADKNGTATLEKESDFWCISCDDDDKNILGHAIIVHASADDFKSQPSGAAGARVGCGEIKLK